MRLSEAGLALVRRVGPDGAPEYLVQWNDNWQRFSLPGGHVEPGESFRACCAREVAEELGLSAGTDFRVAPEPEVRRHATAPDGRPVSAQVRTVLTLAGVIPVEES